MFYVGGYVGCIGVGYWLYYYWFVFVYGDFVDLDGMGLVMGLGGGIWGGSWVGDGVVYGCILLFIFVFGVICI